MSNKVSLVVPVYKSDAFLHRCINSILKQSFKDWELILVDDGSPDNSGKICDYYSKLYPQIKVIHKNNGGVSSARNAGLDIAQSEWVCFIDSDDYIDINFLDIVNEADSDLVILSSQYIGVDGSLIDRLESCGDIKINNHLLVNDFISANLDSTLFKTPWAKLFRRDLIGDLRFDQSISVGEDTLFLYKYLHIINSLETHSSYKYFWQTSDESISLKHSLSPKQAVITLEKIYSAYKQLNANCIDVEFSMFLYYFRIMDKSGGAKQMRIWFKSRVVATLEHVLKHKLHRLDYLNYKLWRFPVLRTIFLFLLRIICYLKKMILFK